MPRSVGPVLWVIGSLLTFGCGPRRDAVSVTEISATDVSIAKAAPLEFAPGDWPMWRGPRGDGTALEADPPTVWSADAGVVWIADVPGRGHSSPIVVGDQVVLATADEGTETQSVIALSRETGELRWQTKISQGGFPGSGKMHAKSTHANGTLACDNAALYVSLLHHDAIHLTSLDLQGKILWSTEVGPFESKFGYAASPLPYRSAVIVAADHQGGGYLAALDRASGKILWRRTRPAVSSYSSPLIASIAGRDQLVISGGGRLTSYDPATGETLWDCEAIAEATCGTPVTDGQHVFASGGYPERETVCVAADGSARVVWRDRTKVYEPSLVVAGDGLFTVSDDGVATCWRKSDGKVAWRERLGGSYSASPVVCGSRIYVPNLAGETIVFEATTEAYRELARNRLGDDVYASPAVSGNELFLRVGFGSGGARREKLVRIAQPDAT